MEEQLTKTGTTTIGIKCRDGIVLAADKRATAGHMIVDKRAEKLHQLDTHIAITIAGLVSDAQFLTKLARAEIQLKKIAHLGISDYIDFVITSEEVGAEKPSKRIFYAALDKLNCDPGEAVMIGDDLKKDISGAEKLGIKAYKSFDEFHL